MFKIYCRIGYSKKTGPMTNSNRENRVTQRGFCATPQETLSDNSGLESFLCFSILYFPGLCVAVCFVALTMLCVRCCRYTFQPAAVPVCDRWLSLPDEVWLSILSLLPHSYLCRVSQVCSRLHTLATDHTLCESARCNTRFGCSFSLDFIYLKGQCT